MELDLGVNLAPHHPKGLRLKNPLMLASGTCGYGPEVASFINLSEIGAIVCKGTTLEPREGNPPPRLVETPSGLINSIGLQNPGVEAVIADLAPLWSSWKTIVIVNIAAERKKDYPRLASRLEGVAGVAALEVNISCPNVAAGGVEFASRPRIAAEVVKMVREASSLPLLVKLTPHTAGIREVCEAVAKAGADAITIANTFKAMAIDIETARPVLGAVFGGLSGPAIKPIVLALVYQAARAVEIPIVASGGISTAEDALEYLMAGARAFQIGTALLTNPASPSSILQGVRAFMERKGINRLEQLVGQAQEV